MSLDLLCCQYVVSVIVKLELTVLEYQQEKLHFPLSKIALEGTMTVTTNNLLNNTFES